MKKVLQYLKPYWLFALLTPITMIVEVLVDLLQPTLMSRIVDAGVLGGNMPVVISTGLTMFGLVVIGGLGGLGSAALGITTAQRFGNDLRKATFSQVMSLSFQQTDIFTTGSLVTRLTNDCQMVQEMVNMGLRMFVRSFMLFAGGIFMALSLNVNFGLVLIVALPLMILILIIFLGKAKSLFGKVQGKLDRVNSVVQENVIGARVVKAYVREDYEVDRFGTANNELVATNLKVLKLVSLIMPLMMFVMNLSVIAIIIIGGLQVEAQAMKVGQVMAAVTYVSQILMSMMMLSMLFQTVSRANASANRIAQVMNTAPAIASGEKVTSIHKGGSVEFSHVSFSYPSSSNRPVLSDIHMKILPGETFAILGSTGSGKTSLVSLIPRFYDVTRGEVLVDGENVKAYELESLRSRIGMVLQKSELFTGTIADNIRWGNPEASEEEVHRAAKIAQADEFITGFKEGYETLIGEKGSSLSGGQKQRVAIARAILKKPEILIFDDATSALDLNTEARLQRALKESLQDTTVIIIAQRVASVMNADRIAVLDQGGLAACAPHDTLMKTSEIYKDIYHSQMREGEDHE
jgi:ATP-binding cassette subfamily B protein